MSTSPFQVPDQLKVYDSDAIDPTYQLYYTYAWTSFAGLVVLWGLPRVMRRAKRSWEYGTWKGVSEREDGEWVPLRSGEGDEVLRLADATMAGHTEWKAGVWSRTRSLVQGIARAIFWRHIPIASLSGLLPFNQPTLATTNHTDPERRINKPPKRPTFRLSAITVGQVIVFAGYIALVCVTVLNKSELKTNANRPGYIALSMLTPLLLLSTPSSPLTSLLTSSYPTLNLMHRLIGVLLFLSITLHGGLWTYFYTLGVGKGTGGLGSGSGGMGVTGWGAWAMVFVLAASGGVRRLRRVWFEVFKVIHFIAFIAFFILITFHTSTSRPWIYPPIALYTADLFFKLIRFKFQDAYLIDIGGGMTMIHLPYAQTGFYPTQHMNLRLLDHHRSHILQSHPLTITSAAYGSGLTFYAKSVGGWTGRLNELATTPTHPDRSAETLFIPGRGHVQATPVQMILDGPYGGLDIDLMGYEEILMIAGGSGMTFILGAMEGVLKGFGDTSEEKEKRRRTGLRSICVVWSVKDLAIVNALIPTLQDLHHRIITTTPIDIRYTIHITSLTSPTTPNPSNSKHEPPNHPDQSTLKLTPSSSSLPIHSKPGRIDIPRLVEDHLGLCCVDSVDGLGEMGEVGDEHGPSSDSEPGDELGELGVGVIVCGPKRLVLECEDSISITNLHNLGRTRGRGRRSRNVGFHSQLYSD